MMRITHLLGLLLVYISSFCQDEAPKFKRLSTNEGLSQGHVTSIIKDHKGFMWFGTDEGLNRFDGYQFKIYKHDPDISASIRDDVVQDLMEDKNGDLLIGTSHGLDKYDREKDVFKHYNPGNSNMDIKDIFLDSKNRLWLGTLNGLYLLNSSNGISKHYEHSDSDINSISHNYISHIIEDDDGNLWIGTRDGLNKFNPQTERFVCYKHDAQNKSSISGNRIKALFKNHQGRIWVGTQGFGISLFNAHDNSFSNFLHDPNNKNTVNHNDILSFTEGNNGSLWIGTENGGISVLDYEKNIFTTYLSDAGDNTTLSNNSIHSLYRDDVGNIWAGTWSGGVNFLPNFGNKFRCYRKNSFNNNSLSSNSVLSITGDSDGNIWIGTDGGGLNRFNPASQTFTRYTNNVNNPNSISTDYVMTSLEINKNVLAFGYHRTGFDFYNLKTGKFSRILRDKNLVNIDHISISVLFKDREGNLWIGAHDHGGLYYYNLKDRIFKVYQPDATDSTAIKGSSISSILEDKAGSMWIGTDEGLELLDKSHNRFIHHQTDSANKYSISNNFIHSIFEDSKGNLWLGTSDGINYYDKQKGQFTAYTDKNGLANNVVYGILQDRKNNLWFSSNKGLSRFNPITKICRNYEVSDGLQDNSFKPNACYQSKTGEMYFGGVNGFNVFNPDSIKDNTFIPTVVVTDFRIFNKSINMDEKNPILRQQITETKEIILSYNQSVLTFEFSALNYTLPEKNLYAYKLAGFDKEWTYSGNRRTATYTNLDPGHYELYIKAANNDGIWNTNPTSIAIIITPPFWLTWWFELSMVLAAISLVILVYKWRIRAIYLQKSKLQFQVLERTEQLARSIEEEKKARIEAENANKIKSVFLATMSHEIRTPMNGVIGIAALLKETEQTIEQREFTDTIISCGEGLLNVINDVLDFSKIESDSMELENLEFDLANCIEEIFDVFSEKVAKTDLELIYEINPDVPARIIGDAMRLRQILMNLVSNAVKFTQKGEVFIEVVLNNHNSDTGSVELCFRIKDTGIGISAEKMNRLFKPFSQVDSSTTRKYGGTGLGLVISEKLVKLMGGTIKVESEPGSGTTFSFTIKTLVGKQVVNNSMLRSKKELENKKVLVIDDNPTNLLILKKQLENWQLKPTLAASGGEALSILQNSGPFDILLTDMNMPVMNGIELALTVVEKYPQLPMILLSSVGDNRVKKNPQLFKYVLMKPIKEATLCNCLLNIFQESDTKMPPIKSSDQKLTTEFAKQYPLKILVADDNKINQVLAMKVLSKLGYNPDIVENGQEAIDAYKENNYDLILMDVQMPEMDGMEATRNIRQQFTNAQPVIIAMTANAMQGDKEACLNAGMDDYLSKPVKLQSLITILEKWALLVIR